MIEETTLPNVWVVAAAVTGGRRRRPAVTKILSAADDRGSYNAFQTADPEPEIKFRPPLHKEMDVIAHDHITAERHVLCDAAFAILNHRTMNDFIR